ncbi:MAG: NAD(P)/FAD-dependent oxidoreductase [Symbiobacteriia bacterium]
MGLLFAEPGPAARQLLEGDVYDVAVIGAGPAGAAAALYAARSRLSTVVLDKAPSNGALAITHQIANYPGVQENLTGQELLDRMRQQAADFGALFVQTSVQTVTLDREEKEIFTNDGILRARSVVVAVGARGRTRKLPGEEELLGRGVSYCATCDGAFYQDKVVAVVGDNEEAVQEARVLTEFARKVYLLVPGEAVWGMESGERPILPNLEIRLLTKTLRILGSPWITGVEVQHKGASPAVLPVDGAFVYLSGSRPGTDFLMGQAPLDEEGYMLVDDTMATAVAGVYAAGDARRTPIKQAVIAAADGALAAVAAEKYVRGHRRLVQQR